MNVSKKLFSGILCASLLMAGAQTRCSSSNLANRSCASVAFLGFVAGVSLITKAVFSTEAEKLDDEFCKREEALNNKRDIRRVMEPELDEAELAESGCHCLPRSSDKEIEKDLENLDKKIEEEKNKIYSKPSKLFFAGNALMAVSSFCFFYFSGRS